MDLTAQDQKKLIILGILAGLAILLIPLALFKPAKSPTLPSDAPPPIPSTFEAPQLTLPCPVANDLCSTGKEIFNGSVFLGIGYTLPKGTKILSSMPGSAFLTYTQDKAYQITSHSKVVVSGQNSQKGIVLIYEFFSPKSTGNSTNKTVRQGEELGLTGEGTFPKNVPYNRINLLMSVFKDGKPINIKASELLPL